MIPIDSHILGLAAVGLPGARPLTPSGWGDRLDDVTRHGLAGLLGWAAAEGLVDLDEAGAHRLDLRLESEAIRAVQLEGELIRLERVLVELPAVVLKGAVLAHGAYSEPSLRPFTDLDILVAGRHQGAAVRALEELGYERSRPEPAPGYDARVGKALTLTHPGGVVVDLHRTLVAGNLGDSIDVDGIIADRRTVPVGPVAVPGPSWEAHLVETALHAVMGDGLARALSIRDIAQVALHPDLDADLAVELVRRWKASDPVAHGLRAAIDGLGIELPDPLRALAALHPVLTPALPASPRSAKRRLDELFHGDMGRRLTLTRALVAPSPAFMRWNYGTRATPQLYGRRWLALYRRALEARGDPLEQPPAAAELGTDAPDLSAPPPTSPTADRSVRRTAVTSPSVVALTQRPPVAHVTPRARHDYVRGGGERARLHPRPRSRQQRWSDQRARESRDDTPPSPPPVESGSSESELPDPPARRGVAAVPIENGKSLAYAGAALLVLAMLGPQLGIGFLGLVLVPAAALLFAVAATRSITRRRPDEAWIGRFLILGVVVKLVASFLRYLTLVVGYESRGDSFLYAEYGKKFANGWMGNGIVPELDNWRKTNFIRVFTGWVYFLFGSNTVAGFFIFSMLALVGSYLWYRATVDAVPDMNKKLYLGLVLFAPSIAFWPSSVGKEALMQFGIGVMALGTSFLLRQKLLSGLAIGLAGGWLLWVVRPHLLALVTLAAGCAYVAGRVRGGKKGVGALSARPIGILVIALLMAFAVSQATASLGMEGFSLSSIETELDEVSEQTGQGGSQFDSGGNSLSPLNLPEGAVTVLLRPLPYEAGSPFELLASLESMIVLALIIKRFPSVRTAFRRARGTPFLLYCIILLILFAATFSSFANFGLLVRQRSLVMPALFVLVAVNPVILPSRRQRASPDTDAPATTSALPPDPARSDRAGTKETN